VDLKENLFDQLLCKKRSTTGHFLLVIHYEILSCWEEQKVSLGQKLTIKNLTQQVIQAKMKKIIF